MAQGTSTGTRNGIAIFLALVAVAALGWALFTNPEGPSELPPMPEDDNQVFVDINGLWTPRRNMEVSFQVGAQIHGPERFDAGDPGRFGVRIAVDRGTEIVLLMEEGTDSPGGSTTCEIRVNEHEQVVDDTTGGMDRCRVTLVT